MDVKGDSRWDLGFDFPLEEAVAGDRDDWNEGDAAEEVRCEGTIIGVTRGGGGHWRENDYDTCDRSLKGQ